MSGVKASTVRAPAPTRGWRTLIDSSDLPPELRQVVRDLISRVRLWPSERADVASELIAHFADGLAAGRSPSDLKAAFGDARAAATLIARARRRSRPPWYQAARWGRRGMGAALVVVLVTYAWLAARYYAGEPRITRNYAAELTRASQAGPPDDRAWPVYLSAIRSLGPDPAFLQSDDYPESPTDPRWPEAVAYLRARAEGVALLRRAASKPALGVVYRDTMDPEYAEALQARQPFTWTPEPEDENPMLFGVLLPQLGEFRRAARLLRFDAREAAITGDRARVVADIEALMGISRQAWSEPFIISDLVALAVLAVTCDVVCEALQGGLLSPEDVRAVAHGLARSPTTALDLDFSAEQWYYHDFEQRFFSDDGRGDGHTLFASAAAAHRSFGTPDPAAKLFVRAALPAITVTHPSRAEFHRLTLEATAAAQRDQALPLWRRSERTCDVPREQLDHAMGAVFPPMRSLLGSTSIGRTIISRDVAEARRQATLTALALEAHRAARGRYPSALAELVPARLPRVPTDAADGRPLRYRLVGNRPLLYSVGCDGDDDGGRPPAAGNRHASRFGPEVAAPPADDAPGSAPPPESDGDWILYPPLPPTSPPARTR